MSGLELKSSDSRVQFKVSLGKGFQKYKFHDTSFECHFVFSNLIFYQKYYTINKFAMLFICFTFQVLC